MFVVHFQAIVAVKKFKQLHDLHRFKFFAGFEFYENEKKTYISYGQRHQYGCINVSQHSGLLLFLSTFKSQAMHKINIFNDKMWVFPFS
jgi:hypothetical protein